MANTLMSLLVKLGVDTNELTSGLEAAEGKAQKAGQNIGSSLSSAGAKMMKVGAGLTAGVTLPIVAAGASFVSAASDLEEATNATAVVFGNSQQIIENYGQTVAASAGLAQSEFKQAAAVTGAFLKNLGFDQTEAANKTIELTERASDMASIFNTDVSQALGAIQSGLKGEFNPLEQFGVKLNAAAIEAEALSMGLGSTTVDMNKVEKAQISLRKASEKYTEVQAKFGDTSLEALEAANKMAIAQASVVDALAGGKTVLSDAEKAQAALGLIMKQTDQFAGDFKNTSDGLANSTKIMKAEFTDAAAALGTQLLPIGLKIVQFLSNLVDKFTALSPAQQKTILIIAGIAAAIGPLVTIVGGLVSAIGAIIPVVTAVAGVITFPLIAIIAAVIAVIALLYAAWTNNWGGIQEKFAAFVAWIKPVWDAIWTALKTGFEFVWAQVKTIWEAFSALFQGDFYTFGEKLREGWDRAWELIKAIASMAWDFIKDALANFVSNTINFFKNVNWGDVGRNIIMGIINGALALRQWAIDQLVGLGKGMVQAFQGFFGIHSPSKLMETLIGRNLAMGITVGFEKQMELAPISVGASMPPLGNIQTAPIGGYGGAPVININIENIRSLSDIDYLSQQVARKLSPK